LHLELDVLDHALLGDVAGIVDLPPEFLQASEEPGVSEERRALLDSGQLLAFFDADSDYGDLAVGKFLFKLDWVHWF
jgi:hypothetical protein